MMNKVFAFFQSRKAIDWFYFFLLLGPFLDVASYLGIGGTFSLSILVRTFYLGVLFVLFLRKKKDLGYFFCFTGIGILLFCFSVFYLKHSFFESVSSTLKILFLPLSLLYFRDVSYDEKRDRVLEMVLFTYLLIFVFSYLLGIGADVYLESDGKSGFKGLFYSINEFSAIVVSLFFYVSCQLKKSRHYGRLGLLFFLTIVTSLLIGTKVLFGGILFTVFYLLYLERDFLFFQRTKIEKLGIVIGMCLILFLGCFFFSKTRIYENMKVQQEFFQVNHVFSYDFLNRVIFNDRLTFVGRNYDYFMKQPLLSQCFGIGLGETDVKLVELDGFDLLFRYGIVGFVFFAFALVIPSYTTAAASAPSVCFIILVFVLSAHSVS